MIEVGDIHYADGKDNEDDDITELRNHSNLRKIKLLYQVMYISFITYCILECGNLVLYLMQV